MSDSAWTRIVEIYDPVSNTYQSTGSLNVPRHGHSATLLLDGRVLVVGGYANYQYLDGAEIYNPANGTWTATQPLFSHGVDHSAILLKDGRVLVVGGSMGGDPGPDDRAEIFNSVGNTWSAAAYHEGIATGFGSVLLSDGRVLFTSGRNTDTYIYNPINDTWQPGGAISIRRTYPETVLLKDGRVMVSGGDATNNNRSMVDIYNPTANTWSQAASLHQGRLGHTATALPDGRVMVAGGFKEWDSWQNPGNYINSVEIYNPATDHWEDGPALNSSRAFHTSTLLQDGRLFVAGGRTSAFLNSSELLENNCFDNDFVVTPLEGLEANGQFGGPFNPLSATYRVSNTWTGDIAWTATVAQNWVTVTPASGTLGAGASEEVMVALNGQANGLSAGTYFTSVVFSNQNNGQIVGRAVSLMVTSAISRADRYVSLSGAHIYPFTNWITAATNIQAAIDAAEDGDTIWVTNGVYDSGGVAISDGLTNRIAITKAITVRSVNGPAVTVIRGSEAPGGGNGDGAVRCAYMTDGVVLAGFTLTNGHTRVAYYSLPDAQGGGVWCESASAILSNCVLTGNSADGQGGGAYGGTLYNCTLTGNSAYSKQCAAEGGGVFGGTLYNCTLTGNHAWKSGGTAYSALYNCIVYYNTAGEGPNSYFSSFDHCCTTPLPPGNGNINNEPGIVSISNPRLLLSSVCINAGTNRAWMTHAVDMDGEDRLNGIVDIGADECYSGGMTGPMAVGITSSWLKVCVGYPLTFQADIQGRALGYVWTWQDGAKDRDICLVKHSFPSVGVYAVTLTASNFSGSASATVEVVVVKSKALYVSPSGSHTTPYDTWEKAATNIQTAIDEVEVGGLVWVTNGVYETGGRAVHGTLTNRVSLDKPVTVRSINGPTVTEIRGSEALGGGDGDGAVRCVYMANGSLLVGFTLTNGHTRTDGDWEKEQCGGGVWCESASAILSNCVLTGNSAYSDAGGSFNGTLYHCTLTGNYISSGSASGGGAFNGILYNCTLTDNRATHAGGGTYGGILYNCTLSGNSAALGGGAYQATMYNCVLSGNSAALGGGACNGALYNCIVYYNTAENYGATWDANVTLVHTCTTPDPGGTRNITDEPQFMNAAAGDYRLLPSSPCVDAGINQDWMIGATDLAGNPRILNGTVDMGAYEFAFQGSFKIWLQGSYDTNTHEMTAALNAAGHIPLTSPYADDQRQVSEIPSNAVDWVLLQLRKTTNSIPFISKSVFLGNEGHLLTDGGTTGIMLEASTGTYYVEIKHRNHLAVMSMNPVPFTDRFVSYDFTTNVDQYYGGTNGAIQLESNVWGMIAGDADGDGEILSGG